MSERDDEVEDTGWRARHVSASSDCSCCCCVSKHARGVVSPRSCFSFAKSTSVAHSSNTRLAQQQQQQRSTADVRAGDGYDKTCSRNGKKEPGQQRGEGRTSSTASRRNDLAHAHGLQPGHSDLTSPDYCWLPVTWFWFFLGGREGVSWPYKRALAHSSLRLTQ